MKIIFYSLLITLFACSSQVEEFPVSSEEVDETIGDAGQEDANQDAVQTYPTPSKSDNKRGSGCRSVFYIYGKKVVVPCAPDVPHGPIYESDNLKTEYVEK